MPQPQSVRRAMPAAARPCGRASVGSHGWDEAGPPGFTPSGPERRATAHAEQSSGRGRCGIGALRRRLRHFKSPLTFAPSSCGLPARFPHPRMHGPPLRRIATRNLPRLKLGLTPTLRRTARTDEHAKLHPTLFERPHRSVRRLAHPPVNAGLYERRTNRTLRRAASAAPRLHFDGD
jgi:hypothetical protein